MEFCNGVVEQAIKYKLGIFDGRSPQEKDLDEITDLFISNLNPRGEIIGVDISDIEKLKKLQFLELKGFDINRELLEIINRLQQLTTLELYSCHSGQSLAINLKKLKELILNNCSINLEGVRLPKILKIRGADIVDISKWSDTKNLRELDINNSKIVNSRNIKDIQALIKLNLDGSNLDDESIVSELARKIEVSYNSEFLPLR